ALLKMARGEVAASRLAGPQGGNPAPSGLEGGTEPQQAEAREEEPRPLTRNRSHAYGRRQKRGTTAADAKRAQMEGRQWARGSRLSPTCRGATGAEACLMPRVPPPVA